METVCLVASCGLQFTAQPEAPAFVLAGASGWAVNELINSPPETPGEIRICSPLVIAPFRRLQFFSMLKVLRHEGHRFQQGANLIARSNTEAGSHCCSSTV
jgi:hypothetical protein